MSQESSKVLTRQWNIIQFLLDSEYVSTTNIEEHLKSKGITATQRTIQRDLNLLETLFPLECRRDCMPFNWRWKRVEQTIKGLSLSQALILRLVDEQLSDVLPEHTQQELLPLFQKAKLITSNTMYTEYESSILDILTRRQKMGVGIVQEDILSTLRMGITSRVNSLYRDILNLDEKYAKKSLDNLSVILESYELPELAKVLKL